MTPELKSALEWAESLAEGKGRTLLNAYRQSESELAIRTENYDYQRQRADRAESELSAARKEIEVLKKRYDDLFNGWSESHAKRTSEALGEIEKDLGWVAQDHAARHTSKHCDECPCSGCHVYMDSYARTANKALARIKDLTQDSNP